MHRAPRKRVDGGAFSNARREHGFPHRLVVNQHGDGHIGTLDRISRRLREARTGLGKRVGLPRGSVVHRNFVPRVDQVEGHRCAHVSGSKECEFQGNRSFSDVVVQEGRCCVTPKRRNRAANGVKIIPVATKP